MIPTTTRLDADPWHEDRPEGARRALKAVDDARRQAATLAAEIPSMEGHLQNFSDDLSAIATILRKDDTAFRKIRPLTAVHLPAITSSLEALRDLRGGETGERLAALEGELALCLTAASQARSALAADEVTTLEIEAATLRDHLGPDAEAPPAPPPAPDPGLLGRAWSLGQATTTGLAGRARSIGSDLADRAGSGTAAANTYVSGLLVDGADAIASPVATRISAARAALSSASLGAILGGAITAIVFPPAIPFAMGLAALDGMSSYEQAVAEGERETARRRADRRSSRNRDLAGQIARFCGTSTIVRTETPHIHVTIDMVRETASGTILSGRYAGCGLDEFPRADLTWLATTAPDPETADLIRAYRNVMAPR